MDNKQKRLNITISFSDEEMYNYVKHKPNSSYYIRELVEKEINNIRKNKKNTSLNENIDINNFVSSVFDNI